jgi:hypothetical protein
MGPKTPRSTVLPAEEEAMVIAFRKHALLALDDCLYALQASTPHLTRTLLSAPRDKPVACDRRREASQRPFKTYSIGYFHIDIAEVRTEEGKLHLFVAIDLHGRIDLCAAGVTGEPCQAVEDLANRISEIRSLTEPDEQCFDPFGPSAQSMMTG